MSALIEGVLAGDRRALARAITLIESTRERDADAADAMLNTVLPKSGGAIRIGITGVPGVGKSTFIERFGLDLIEAGHRVAVLAVDPTSKVSGGSILGDKTRMQELSRNEGAFIRPTPAGATLGGVPRRTRETMLLCEAAGYDVVLVETVGVGQSETAVADMVDVFLLLLLPGGGDELQGLKKGIVELADILVVNKADGALAEAAQRTVADYHGALQLLRPASAKWRPRVLSCSSAEGHGIETVWQTIGEHQEALQATGELAKKRAEQARRWMWNQVSETLMQSLRAHPAVAARLSETETRVMAGQLTPTAAARQLIQAFRGETA